MCAGYAGALSKCTPEFRPTNYVTEHRRFGHRYTPRMGLTSPGNLFNSQGDRPRCQSELCLGGRRPIHYSAGACKNRRSVMGSRLVSVGLASSVDFRPMASSPGFRSPSQWCSQPQKQRARCQSASLFPYPCSLFPYSMFPDAPLPMLQ